MITDGPALSYVLGEAKGYEEQTPLRICPQEGIRAKHGALGGLSGGDSGSSF